MKYPQYVDLADNWHPGEERHHVKLTVISCGLAQIESSAWKKSVELFGWRVTSMRAQQASREPLVCGSSASHTVSGARSPMPKVVSKLPQKLRISSREAWPY
jgi:hypothetical protein